jgi:hypothetical protein
MAQLVFDSKDNLVLISLDNKNGFNTLPRGLICSGLAEFAPELLYWFQYAYGGPSPSSAKGNSSPTWLLGANRETPSDPSCTPSAFSLPFSLFRMLSPSGSRTMPVGRRSLRLHR